jgi:hypothetical protein
MNDVVDPADGGDPYEGELSLGIAAGSVAAFGVILAGVAWVAFGAFAAESVAVGAALVALDLYVLGRVIRALFAPPGADGSGANKALWTFIGFAKLFVLFGGSWWLLASGLVHPLGLAAGIVALPLGLAVAAVSMSARAANRGRRSPAVVEP